MASDAQRAEQTHTSFRRMTRYEYNYALQDLLGVELEFAKGLPPESASEDGFKNSSQLLQMTGSQYGTYLELNRKALNRATVRGERPDVLVWAVSAERASVPRFAQLEENGKQASGAKRPRGRQRGRRGGKGAHYKNTKTGKTVAATWSWQGAKEAWAPTTTHPEVPDRSEYVAVLPPAQRLVVELGNRLPDAGALRVRVRAWRASTESQPAPTLALEFGWQGDKDWRASSLISARDLVIDASAESPRFYQWDIPLGDINTRNPVRKTKELGASKTTNPSEYIRLRNTSPSKSRGHSVGLRRGACACLRTMATGIPSADFHRQREPANTRVTMPGKSSRTS